MRTTGLYHRYNNLKDEDLLAKAWIDAAAGINLAISVYATGKDPRYPTIDSVSYDAQSEIYARLLQVILTAVEDRGKMDLFFDPSLQFAIELMLANRRDEAGRFEPMEKGENAAAFQRIPSIDWKRYPYTAIVVPGAGSDRTTIPASPLARLRSMFAAKRYHDGKAPLIVVSGGFVHPSQTPYCEAIEMKKILMREFNVPENAILIDPHARHTTTNLRNAARLIYRYGIPFEQKALVTTDLHQSAYIESPLFQERCTRELGYQPHQLLKRTSPQDLEFLPKIESLSLDASDLLDP